MSLITDRPYRNGNKKLSILFVTPWYPTESYKVGGVFIREYADAIQDFAQVAVLHFLGNDSSLNSSWVVEGVESESTVRTYRLWYRKTILPKVSIIRRIWAFIHGYRQIVKDGFRPDMIHAHTYQVALPVFVLSRIFRLPLVVSEHSSNFPRGTLSRSALLEAKLTYGNADFVLPVSDYLQQSIVRCGVNANFNIVPNVVDTALFSRSKSADETPRGVVRFLFVGMMQKNPTKGIDILLRAFAHLNTNDLKWALNMIGDGPARPDHENRARQLGIQEQVMFCGQCSKIEIAQEMQDADVVVVSSLFETFSVVAAEALCCGTPVLSTRCGGPEGFITPEVGHLVERDNEVSLSDGLRFMVDNLHQFDADAISEYATSVFSRGTVALKLKQIYDEALSRQH